MNTDNLAETSRGRILVVDDDSFNLKILGRLLQPHHDVFAALSGVDALRIAACAPQPDLILLDVMMPDMNGFDVIVRLRDNPSTRDIPVIFATGLDSTEDEEHGLELGAVDYITKPYRPLIILARIRTQLELKRTRERLASLETELAKRINLT